MSVASYLHSLYLCWCSPHKADRSLYRCIVRTKPCRIVEVGVDDASRACRMIKIAQRFHPTPVHYCGIDLFEARERAVLPLKQAHLRFAKTGAKVRLIPGDVVATIARNANFLTQTDLLIFDVATTDREIEQAAAFWPRIVHEDTRIARYVVKAGVLKIEWLDPVIAWQTRRVA